MVETVLLIASLIIIIGLYRYSKHQYRQGADDLFQLFARGAYDQKVAMYRSLNVDSVPNGTVFVGDSITQDYNVYEFFKGKNVYNRGIGGDTSEGVLNRLDESVFSLKPKAVFLLIGTNDLVSPQFSLEKTMSNIQAIIKNLQAFDSSLKIHLLSILPVNRTIDATTVGLRNNSLIDKLNQQLKDLKAVHFIDLYPSLLDANKNLSEKYTIEGLHLNAEGYRVITESLRKFV
jgi:lysophospholipase L1-like esterase